jgi:hypothetical protein
MQRALCWSVILVAGTLGVRPAAFAQAASIPLTNDLGALLLGFFGGYYARAWLPEPGDDLHFRRRSAARKPRPRAAG